MDSKAAEIGKRLTALKALRLPHQSVWRDCFYSTFPIRGSGFDGQLDAQQGQNLQADLLDTTAAESAEVLTSNVQDGMTPANALWFGLDVGQESDEEKRWLAAAAKLLWENIHMSNFDAESFDANLDGVIAGWFALFVDEADDGGFQFEQWRLSELYVAASRPGGRIDTVYREFELKASQVFEKYGDACSEQVKKLAKDKPDDMVQMVHAIYPRKMYMRGAKLARNFPIASCVVEVKTAHLLHEGGFHEMPVIVPRWFRLPGSAYAIGPVYNVLPDQRMLNELKRMELAAADIAIAGMWIAEDDGVLNPAVVKVGPRKVIVANSVDSMKSLTSGHDFNVAFTAEERLQAQIRRKMMADQLPPADGPVKTAYEYSVRVSMLRKLLGPIFGRLQAEYLQPLIERCFGIAYRAGIFGEAPESLRGRNFTVKYISPLARSQKLEEVTSIERLYLQAGAISQGRQNTAVFDNLDDDEAMRISAEALGAPSTIIRDAKTVKKIRELKSATVAEAEKRAQQAEQQTMITQAAAKKAAA